MKRSETDTSRKPRLSRSVVRLSVILLIAAAMAIVWMADRARRSDSVKLAPRSDQSAGSPADVTPANSAQGVARSVRTDLALGKKLYETHCASCHGINLEGQPNWKQRLPSGRFPAPPHDDSGHSWHHAGDVLFSIVKFGLVPPYAPQGYESDMPAFKGTLSDDEIRAVLAYIESRWSAKVRDKWALIEQAAKESKK